jgi:hypothetical protein
MNMMIGTEYTGRDPAFARRGWGIWSANPLEHAEDIKEWEETEEQRRRIARTSKWIYARTCSQDILNVSNKCIDRYSCDHVGVDNKAFLRRY